MSGPIVRKYGFPNFEKIFGERAMKHGLEESDKPTKSGAAKSATTKPKAMPKPKVKPGVKVKAKATAPSATKTKHVAAVKKASPPSLKKYLKAKTVKPKAKKSSK